MNAFFTNSQRPVVECLTIVAGILARNKGVFKGTGADKRFVKNAFKNAELPTLIIKIFLLRFFSSHTTERYSNHYEVCMLYGIG